MRSSELGEPAPRVASRTHRTEKKMFLSNLTQFFDDSALTPAAAALLHAFTEHILIEQQSQPRGFFRRCCTVPYRLCTLSASLALLAVNKRCKGIKPLMLQLRRGSLKHGRGFLRGGLLRFKRILKSGIRRCVSAHRSFKYMARSPAYDMHCTSRGTLSKPPVSEVITVLNGVARSTRVSLLGCPNRKLKGKGWRRGRKCLLAATSRRTL